MTRYPVPGQVKTRLFPVLDAEQASALQRDMTAHALSQMRRLRREQNVELEVRYCGGTPAEAETLFGADLIVRHQGDGDLGAKIWRAFDVARAEGVQKSVLLGADCPDATATVLADALDALDEVDSVIGPAVDGGYYLIGMTTPHPHVFEGVSWGSEEVFEQTRERLVRIGATWRALKVLHDVDRPEDLRVWERARLMGEGHLGAVDDLVFGAADFLDTESKV